MINHKLFVQNKLNFEIIIKYSMVYQKKFLLRLFAIFFFLCLSFSDESNVSSVGSCFKENKQQLISKIKKLSPNFDIENKIRESFPANQTLYAEGVVEYKPSKIQQAIKPYYGKYILNIGYLCIFLFILVIVIPLIYCCEKCCRCCVKNVQSLRIVGVCYLILVIGFIGVSIALLKINGDFEGQYKNFKCSLQLMTDDIVNGSNSQEDNITFAGLKFYQNHVKNFYTNLKSIKKVAVQLNETNESLQQIQLDFEDLDKKIKREPFNNFKLTYNLPFTKVAKTDEPINSTFMKVLGTYNTKNSLLFNLSQQNQEHLDTSRQIIRKSKQFQKNSDILEPFQAQINSFFINQINSIQKFRQDLENTFRMTQQGILKNYSVGAYIVLSVCMLACLIEIIFLALIFCSKKFRCLNCCVVGFLVIQWIICILLFAISIAFTISNPTVLYSCNYLRDSIKLEQTFNSKITRLNPQSQGLKTVEKCLSSSKTPYYLYDTYFNETLKQKFNSISSFKLKNMEDPNFNDRLSKLFLDSIQIINNYSSSVILDLEDIEALEQLKSFSIPTPCFSDSWVPNTLQNVIPCANSNMPIVDNKTCPKFQDNLDGCSGCMNTHSLLYPYSSVNQLTRRLTKKYQSPQCNDADFKGRVDGFVFLWIDYYRKKINSLQNLRNNFNTEIKPLISSALAKLDRDINPKYNKVKSWINSQPLTSPFENFQLHKKMDCRMIGKNIEMTTNILCNSGIAYVYYLKGLYSASAMILLFSLCFSIFFIHKYRYLPDQDKVRYGSQIQMIDSERILKKK